MARRSVVTGAAGFIGSHLTMALLARGDEVIALDNFSNGKQENIEAAIKDKGTACKVIEGDIRDIETCHQVCEGADVIFHQAALGSVPRSIEEPELYHHNNVTGTLNMMEAARQQGVKRFIYASSSSVYGDTPTLPKEESMSLHPKSPYAVGKLMTEYYGALYYQTYGLETVGFRYFNVFGPRQDPNSQYAAAIPKFITALIQNEAPTIFGDGEQTRDFTYIKNVVNANLKAAEATDPNVFGQAYNVGCGDRISLNDLIATIKSITGATVEPLYTDPRPGDVRDSQADLTRLQKAFDLGVLVSLSDGLGQTINSYH